MKKFSMEAYKKYLNKRVLTVAGICLLLAAAVVTNVLLNRDVTESKAQTASVKKTEAQTVSTIHGTDIVAQGADEATLSDAQQQKLDLINCMEMELTVENLVRGKGFDDVIVSMHAGSVNVIVGAQSLTDEQVAQILDIVLRETGESAKNVKVSTAL